MENTVSDETVEYFHKVNIAMGKAIAGAVKPLSPPHGDRAVGVSAVLTSLLSYSIRMMKLSGASQETAELTIKAVLEKVVKFEYCAPETRAN